MKQLLIGFILISLFACSSKVTTTLVKAYPPLDYNEKVFVIGITHKTPETATEIGVIKIGDTGFSTNCGWNAVIERAKIEARKAGGNVVKIIKHTPPSLMGSTCDKITAQILRIENINEFIEINKEDNDIVDSTWNYAKLYVFRPKGAGALVGYDVYLGDSVICRVKNNAKQEIIIYQKGSNVLWAKTESKTEIPIEIEFGKEYYLRCTLGMGIMVGRPQLQLVDRKLGKLQYHSIESK